MTHEVTRQGVGGQKAREVYAKVEDRPGEAPDGSPTCAYATTIAVVRGRTGSVELPDYVLDRLLWEAGYTLTDPGAWDDAGTCTDPSHGH